MNLKVFLPMTPPVNLPKYRAGRIFLQTGRLSRTTYFRLIQNQIPQNTAFPEYSLFGYD